MLAQGTRCGNGSLHVCLACGSHPIRNSGHKLRIIMPSVGGRRRKEPASAGIGGSSDPALRAGRAGIASLSAKRSPAHECNYGRVQAAQLAVMIFPVARSPPSAGHSDLGGSAAGAGGGVGGLGFAKCDSSMGTLTSIFSAVIRWV